MNPDNPKKCIYFYKGRCSMKELDSYYSDDSEIYKPITCPFYKGDEYIVE